MALKTVPWSVQDHIATPERQAGFLEAAVELAVEERDPAFLTKALRDVAKARGMTDVASAAGITREGLYKALSDNGDPRLSTFLGILKALGLRLSISEANIAIADEREPTERLTVKKGRVGSRSA